MHLSKLIPLIAIGLLIAEGSRCQTVPTLTEVSVASGIDHCAVGSDFIYTTQGGA